MIRISDLKFAYRASTYQLRISHLEIARCTKTAIVGPSGSGKSTLLSLISGEKLPDQGMIVANEQSINLLDDFSRRQFRARHVGFVFQDFELLEYLTVEENVRLPYLIHSDLRWDAAARNRLNFLIEQTNLMDKRKRFPEQLSQGERQRVAICRALVTSPSIVLADEPTGSLDPHTAGDVLRLLLEQVTLHSATLLMVTHDHSLLPSFDRTIDLTEFSASRSDATTLDLDSSAKGMAVPEEPGK